jgi:hypothetical protein
VVVGVGVVEVVVGGGVVDVVGGGVVVGGAVVVVVGATVVVVVRWLELGNGLPKESLCKSTFPGTSALAVRPPIIYWWVSRWRG